MTFCMVRENTLCLPWVRTRTIEATKSFSQQFDLCLAGMNTPFKSSSPSIFFRHSASFFYVNFLFDLRAPVTLVKCYHGGFNPVAHLVKTQTEPVCASFYYHFLYYN